MEESEGTFPVNPNSSNRYRGVVGCITNGRAPSVPKEEGLGVPQSGSARRTSVSAANINKISRSCCSCPGLYGYNHIIPGASGACWPPERLVTSQSVLLD
jgi:hypothetical protein